MKGKIDNNRTHSKRLEFISNSPAGDFAARFGEQAAENAGFTVCDGERDFTQAAIGGGLAGQGDHEWSTLRIF